MSVIVRQTTAMLIDAYRELAAGKLFWVTMLLSFLCVAVFAMIGLNERGITVLWYTIPIEVFNTNVISEPLFYKMVFLNLGIGIWLTWVATVLALVSTSGIYPTLLTGGQIETMLSKPISRWRLFLTKFGTGLLFVALQVSVFCVASVLVIGLRGGAWMPEILLSIPIVLAFFSFLFSIMVLLGMLTRSTIASLLLTILVWFVLFLVNTTDGIIVSQHEGMKIQANKLEERLELAEENARVMYIATQRREGNELPDDYQATDDELYTVNVFLPSLRDRLEDRKEMIRSLAPWRQGIFIAKTLLPKTSETIGLLNRYAMSQEDLDALMDVGSDKQRTTVDEETGEVRVSQADQNRAMSEAMSKRSVGWVLGTSFAFEAVMLLIAGTMFARRDF
ncbi:MAG: ABC transporter permease [Phycisphaerales bacterium JB061]